ncbi:MAG: tRNA (adenosine(37)-N6)-threonylcarbamoyltransferase complex dimerization subunit type 1 TsaB [Rhodospirillaceae bacterium]|nr:tRNA (adenosine(37)-N6)-threonylcarbamoyltransferase complex dimerization subunit type 1 TsaB [Rhodospirillaceae bacterium]
MKILAIDSAGLACTAGVWRDGTLSAHESAAMAQGHAEALMPMIERVMARAALTYAALDRIAVCVGPGSFTGVRVGIATARGLGLAADVPVIGVSATEIFAAMVHAGERRSDRKILAAVDSKRGDVFAQLFDADAQALNKIEVVALDRLAAWCGGGSVVVVGDGAALAVKALGSAAVTSSAGSSCDPAVIAEIASTRPPDPRGALPVYGRAPDVTLRADGGLLRP